MIEDEALSFASALPAAFLRREVVLAPGAVRPYVEEEWRGALVVVERGDLELECTRGGRRSFACGAVLWLAGLPLAALRTAGPGPTVLVAVSRRTDEFPVPPDVEQP